MADAAVAQRCAGPAAHARADPPRRGAPDRVHVPGPGPQYVNMGRSSIEQEPTFRERIDRCSELLQPRLGLDLRAAAVPGARGRAEAAERLRDTEVAQPALFAIEYALASCSMQCGASCRRAMIGHSVGEYVAATLAGVMTLEDALPLIARARPADARPPGAMLAVDRCPRPRSQPLLDPATSRWPR